MTKEELKKYIARATGKTRAAVHSKPPTEQEKALGVLVLRSRADTAKMTAKERRAAILRGSF